MLKQRIRNTTTTLNKINRYKKFVNLCKNDNNEISRQPTENLVNSFILLNKMKISKRLGEGIKIKYIYVRLVIVKRGWTSCKDKKLKDTVYR